MYLSGLTKVLRLGLEGVSTLALDPSSESAQIKGTAANGTALTYTRVRPGHCWEAAAF